MSYRIKSPRKSGPNQTDEKNKPFFQKVPSVQTKLEIGQPGDKYEQEADAMAEKVVNQPAIQQQNLEGIQRVGGEEEEPLQMQTAEEREEGVHLKREAVEMSESEIEEGVNLKEMEEEPIQRMGAEEMEEESNLGA